MLRLPPGYREITSSVTFEVPFASAVTGRAEGTTHRWGEMGIQHSQALSALLPCSRPRDPLFQAEASHPSCLCVLGRAGAEQSHPQGCRAQGTRSMEQHLPAGRRGRTGEQSQILILPARLALVQPWPIGVTPILNQVAQERVVTTLVQAKPYRGKESTSSAQSCPRRLRWGGCTSSSVCFIPSSTPNIPERIRLCRQHSLQVWEDVLKPAREGRRARTRGFRLCSCFCLPLLSLPPSRSLRCAKQPVKVLMGTGSPPPQL